MRPLRVGLLLAAVVLAGCSTDAAGGTDGAPAPGAAPTPAAAATRTAEPRDKHADTEEAAAPRPARPGERFVTLPAHRGGYQPRPPQGAADDYRCFLLDPGLATDAFLTGLRMQAGQGAHHAIVYRATPEQVATARQIDAAAPGPGWQCFGGSGLPDPSGQVSALDAAPWVGGWAPGNPETVLPAGFGVPLPAGTQLVLQMHFSELAGHGRDDSRLRLRLTEDASGLRALQTVLLPAPVELPCAPGQQGQLCDRGRAVLDVMARFGERSGARVAGLHLLCGGDPTRPDPGPTQSCDRRVDAPMTVRAAAAHMHLLGRSMTIEANPGTPRARTILEVPVYDFDDQGGRWLPRPVALRAGDTVRVTCTHDATLRDRLPALANEQHRYVVWGEGTADEMCLGILSVTR